MRRTTLVTGASGFVGQRLVRQLVAGGDRVRVICRRPDSLAQRYGPEIEVVKADILSRAALVEAFEGVGTVFHLAACAQAWCRHPRTFWDVNVEGTRLVLDLAAAAHVDRVVHVSSVLTLPDLSRTWRLDRRRKPTEYERTKLAAEELVVSFVTGGGDAVVVHPARIYGPGPLSDANGVTKMIALYLAGRFRLRLADADALGSYTHVDDVARGLILAAQAGRRGGHYLLGGQHASIRGLLALVAELSGVARRMFRVAPAAAIGMGRLAELWGYLGGRVPITADWVRVYLEDQRIDIRPTVQELGYAPRPLRLGVAQTLEWLGSGGPAVAA